ADLAIWLEADSGTGWVGTWVVGPHREDRSIRHDRLERPLVSGRDRSLRGAAREPAAQQGRVTAHNSHRAGGATRPNYDRRRESVRHVAVEVTACASSRRS